MYEPLEFRAVLWSLLSRFISTARAIRKRLGRECLGLFSNVQKVLGAPKRGSLERNNFGFD